MTLGELMRSRLIVLKPEQLPVSTGPSKKTFLHWLFNCTLFCKTRQSLCSLGADSRGTTGPRTAVSHTSPQERLSAAQTCERSESKWMQ